MQAVSGVFASQAYADHAIETMLASGVNAYNITLLAPGERRRQPERASLDAGEQPGARGAIGSVAGGSSGFTGGSILAAAVIPGVGSVTAVGLLGAAILGAAGGGAKSNGGALEKSPAQTLPEDEIFVYEDALRKGRSVVIVLAENENAAEPLRALLRSEGAEPVDDARHRWWIDVRNAEREHYAASGRDFGRDEGFYRRGFEDALHARSRCKEFDQISAEMESNLADLQRQYPGNDIEEAYTRGYRRGREYYQRFCEEKRAA
ncbi:MAG TPA: hypothetical protein VMT67_06590 [Terriglobales bacterium]|nr:hypothetical protein [Terriglobales bacterium]